MDPAASAAGSDLADVAPAADEESGRRRILSGAGEGESEKKRAGDKCLGPKGRKTDQSLHLLFVKRRHAGHLCCRQGEICATVTAGRGPLSDWSAQVQVCGGRDERQLLVTRVS